MAHACRGEVVVVDEKKMAVIVIVHSRSGQTLDMLVDRCKGFDRPRYRGLSSREAAGSS